MTDVHPATESRRWRLRWLPAGAVAVVAILAFAIFTPGSPLRPQEGPTASPSETTAGTTGPVKGTTTPAEGATPTVPVIPGQSPTTEISATAAAPRTQPTENEDSAPRETKQPVDLTAEATPTEGIEARLVSIEPVEGEVAIPGEVGGPALRITLEVTNNTSEDFDTPVVVVNLYKGKTLSPAGPILNPGGAAVPDTIRSGDSATGVYLFTVDPEERDDVTVEVDLAVGTPIVLFHGAVN